MTDNIEEPLDNQPINPLEDIIDTKNIEKINSNKESENMEVHHHAHYPASPHHKKNWKSYFWEFLMLFLAVFCGFLAEWQLEHVIEHSREKEFIKSMIEDAQIDISNIERVSEANKKTLLYVDSLATACYNYEIRKRNDYEIYLLYRHILSSIESLKPTQRTLLQLNNSGGMRLIRNKPSAGAIIFYDGFEKDIMFQQGIVNNLKYEFVNASYDLFNFKYFNFVSSMSVSQDAKLLSNENKKLTQFANRIAIYGGVLTKYNLDLKEMNENAVRLINTLQKEYHLTDK
ncbi:MAG: hypothetical protein KF781_00160 [Chitinophagaceae bacterium]|nr:hypothetical protein [Chitinophagaceae bacterium]MCW5905146.1 hypothetical protein [Chitinophagaceae bacterium]